MELIPKLHISRHWQHFFHFGSAHAKAMLFSLAAKVEECLLCLSALVVDDDLYPQLTAIQVGVDIELVDMEQRTRLENHLARNPVPIALRVVTHAMCVLTGVYVVNMIVDTHRQHMLTRREHTGKVVILRCTKVVALSHQPAIDVKRSQPVATFEGE